MKALTTKINVLFVLISAAIFGPTAWSTDTNLVLWWKLDEGRGTTVADASGNGYGGTLQGDPLPAWTNGVVSGGLNFDGYQNFVGSDQPISQTFTAITMECWFTANSVSGLNPAVLSTVHDDNPDNDTGYLGALSIYNPEVRPDLGYRISFFMIVDTASANINAFDGLYHHVAGVWDGSQIQLYYDGTLVATTNASAGPVEANCYVRLAYEDTNGGCFLGGNVGEVRIYNRALSSNEVAASYNTDTVGDGIPDWWRLRYFGSGTTTNSDSCDSCDPDHDGYSNLQEYNFGTDPTNSASFPTEIPANLMAWWKLDEGVGTDIADSCGNDNDATLWYDGIWTCGIFSNALSFDGASAEVDAPISDSLNVTNALTISLWVNTTNSTDRAVVSYRAEEYDSGWRLFYQTGHILFQWASPTGSFHGLDAYGNFPSNQWAHLAVTFSSTNVFLYLDGTQIAFDGSPGTNLWLTANYPLRIGRCDNGNSYWFPGKIDDVRLYNRALGTNEIAALYNEDSIGDGIPNWWRERYYGSCVAVTNGEGGSTGGGSTTNGSSCASCSPCGMSNLEAFRCGLPPCVTIIAPGSVCPETTNNASVLGLGTGGSYTWTITDGSLIAGQNTSNITWVAGDAGTVTLGVVVISSVPCTNSGSLDIPIGALLLTNALPDGATCSNYNGVIQASGGTGPYSYTLLSGSLDGLTLSSSGTITGFPVAPGDFTFAVQAKDATHCGSGVYDIYVADGCICSGKTVSVSFSGFPSCPPCGIGLSDFSGTFNDSCNYTATNILCLTDADYPTCSTKQDIFVQVQGSQLWVQGPGCNWCGLGNYHWGWSSTNGFNAATGTGTLTYTGACPEDGGFGSGSIIVHVTPWP